MKIEFIEYHVLHKKSTICPWHENHYLQYKKISKRKVIFLGKIKLRLRKFYHVFDANGVLYQTYRPFLPRQFTPSKTRSFKWLT